MIPVTHILCMPVHSMKPTQWLDTQPNLHHWNDSRQQKQQQQRQQKRQCQAKLSRVFVGCFRLYVCVYSYIHRVFETLFLVFVWRFCDANYMHLNHIKLFGTSVCVCVLILSSLWFGFGTQTHHTDRISNREYGAFVAAEFYTNFHAMSLISFTMYGGCVCAFWCWSWCRYLWISFCCYFFFAPKSTPFSPRPRAPTHFTMPSTVNLFLQH